jgi:hypothetical protein
VRAGGAQQLSGRNENAAIGLFSDSVVAQNAQAADGDKQWDCDEERPYGTASRKFHPYKTIAAILQDNEQLVTDLIIALEKGFANLYRNQSTR